MDTSCPGISFEKVGCYKDAHKQAQRPLPDYLFNDRDSSIQTWSGKWIDWRNWDVYVPQFACRCAHAAKAKNFTHFGMQFYGKFQLVKRVNIHFKCKLYCCKNIVLSTLFRQVFSGIIKLVGGL